MIIGIDGNEANVEKKVGVSVYTFELLKHFRKAASRDLRFIIFLRHKPRYDLPQQNQYFENCLFFQISRVEKTVINSFIDIGLAFIRIINR